MITTPIDFLAGITLALAVIVFACLMHRPPPKPYTTHKGHPHQVALFHVLVLSTPNTP